MYVKGASGEGPVGYIVVATGLGALAAGAAPLMKSTVATTFTSMVSTLIEGVGALFG
jgi:hypothetical protein